MLFNFFLKKNQVKDEELVNNWQSQQSILTLVQQGKREHVATSKCISGVEFAFLSFYLITWI